MIRSMMRASLRKNPVVSVIMAAFLFVGTAMLSAAAMLSIAVAGSVDGFMERARTPHFMQMHAGPVDLERMERFAADSEDVVAFEAIEMLNVDNGLLRLGDQPLDTEIQQNGFVRQPRTMDFLLDESGTAVRPTTGEAHVPLFYADKYGLEVGDDLVIGTGPESLELTIGGFFRDSQMNSTLASSKRMLLSDADFQALADSGPATDEHLLSFRLTDPAAAGDVESAYYAAGLEADGPAMSWSLFTVVNSLNDATTAALFVLMSGIVLVILLLCIRYSLLATLEEDLREIGVMKALGIAERHIAAIYLGKFRILLGAGALAGIVAALLAQDLVLDNVRRQMGEASSPLLGVLVGVAGSALLYLVAMASVRRVLRRMRRITALEALAGEAMTGSRRRPREFVAGARGAAVTVRMAAAQVWRSPAQHATIAAVALLTVLVMLIPFRLGATLRSPEAVTYMGIGEYDIRADLFGAEGALEEAEAIRAMLDGDARVDRAEVFRLEVESATPVAAAGDGDPVGGGGAAAGAAGSVGAQPLRIEYGDPSAFPLSYGDGRAPQSTDEIALSDLSAEGLGVGIGDAIEVASAAGGSRLTVTGTYQDVTNGGKTAKALPGPTADDPAPDVTVAVALAAGASGAGTDRAGGASGEGSGASGAGAEEDAATGVIGAIQAVSADARVIDGESYVGQMTGDITRVLDAVSWVFAGVALLISGLIAGLAVRLMLVQERRTNAIQVALGFRSGHLRRQYLLRVMAMILVGAGIGVLLAGPAGGLVGDAVFSGVGISGLRLVFSPATTALGFVLVVGAALAVTLAGTRSAFGHGLVERLRSA